MEPKEHQEPEERQGRPFYAAQLALVIAIFAGVYAWLAMQPHVNRPLLVVGAVGKLGFFALFVVYGAAGDLAWSSVVNAAPDAVLGTVYAAWLLGRPRQSAAAVR
ncbi:MAG: hypothetical protein AB7H88_15275 [Vicinamibacterales bacterium]